MTCSLESPLSCNVPKFCSSPTRNKGGLAKSVQPTYSGRVTINGESYDVGLTYGEFEQHLRDGGIVTVRGCSIIIHQELMPTRPIGGSEVTVQSDNGGTFYVRTTPEGLNADSWVLRCSANRE